MLARLWWGLGIGAKKGGKMERLSGLEEGAFAPWASCFVVKTENLICKLKAGYSLQADQGCVPAQRAASR